jgi:GMP synthase-like glutamine amidotransferase
MHVLAFRHSPSEGIGSIADALHQRDIACYPVDLYAQPKAPFSVDGASGLILMGGSMSVNDDLPWIPREVDAIRQAIERRIPVLGICLGSQLIARALGARVYPNASEAQRGAYRAPVGRPETNNWVARAAAPLGANMAKEIGWLPIRWTDEASRDPVFAGFRGSEIVFQWHGETFDLPPGAQLLAESEACTNQAFRTGDNIYGLQFHLEATPEIIADWVRQDAACGAAREAVIPIDPFAHAARLAETAATVFSRWCELLR